MHGRLSKYSTRSSLQWLITILIPASVTSGHALISNSCKCLHLSIQTQWQPYPTAIHRHLHFMFKSTFRYVNMLNLLHLSAIPSNPSSSRLGRNDRFNDIMEDMEGRWRNVDNALAVKLQPSKRCKDVSSCSDPIPSSNPLSVIFQQTRNLSSWSLQHISNRWSGQWSSGAVRTMIWETTGYLTECFT